MRALGPPFVESVVAWQARKKPQQRRSIPVEKLLEMRLARRLKQNEQTSGFAERNFGVFEAASGPQMTRILQSTHFFELQILIVKLRVDQRGYMVEQGAPPGESWD